MKYSWIVWDWNGTLLDDVAVCVRIMNRMLEKRHLPRITAAQYVAGFGFPVQDYYVRLGFDFRREAYGAVAAEYTAAYRRAGLRAGLQAGGRIMLERFRRAGLKQAILSTAEQKYLRRQTARLGVSHYFRHLLGTDNYYGAGKLAVGRAWLAETGLRPADILVVGDTVHDYEVAAALGCDCVLLGTGHQSPQRLDGLGVPVIGGLYELAGLVMRSPQKQ